MVDALLLGPDRVKASLKVTKSIAHALVMAAVNFEFNYALIAGPPLKGNCNSLSREREDDFFGNRLGSIGT